MDLVAVLSIPEPNISDSAHPESEIAEASAAEWSAITEVLDRLDCKEEGLEEREEHGRDDSQSAHSPSMHRRGDSTSSVGIEDEMPSPAAPACLETSIVAAAPAPSMQLALVGLETSIVAAAPASSVVSHPSPAAPPLFARGGLVGLDGRVRGLGHFGDSSLDFGGWWRPPSSLVPSHKGVREKKVVAEAKCADVLATPPLPAGYHGVVRHVREAAAKAPPRVKVSKTKEEVRESTSKAAARSKLAEAKNNEVPLRNSRVRGISPHFGKPRQGQKKTPWSKRALDDTL